MTPLDSRARRTYEASSRLELVDVGDEELDELRVGDAVVAVEVDDVEERLELVGPEEGLAVAQPCLAHA